ncbi:MAG: hydrolase, partial [Anaerolineae bacterium]|nr:hydrolase [Anaerolineae bacterium]
SFLLLPDLSPEAEATLVSSGQALHATVLQLPSHGSDRVSSPALLEAVAPQTAVVQVAAGNYQRYPAAAVLDRLGSIPLFRTDQHGRITISTDGTGLAINTEHPG